MKNIRKRGAKLWFRSKGNTQTNEISLTKCLTGQDMENNHMALKVKYYG